jgi:hypothetical protein
VPLIEQYYVAVDRQLKSGFGTYESNLLAVVFVERIRASTRDGASGRKGRNGDKEKISKSAGNRL